MKEIRDIYLFIIGLVICIIVTCGIYYRDHNIKEIEINSEKVTMGTLDDLAFNLENKSIVDNEKLLLSGTVYKKKESINSFHTYILLKAEKSDNHFLVLPTSLVKREDISHQYGEGGMYNYNNSGFNATINLNKLDSNKRYEVFVLYMNNDDRALYNTEIWIEL